MSLLSFLRSLGSGQKPEDENRTDFEAEATEPSTSGAGMPGLADAEAAETAKADLSEFDPPA